MTGNPLRVEDRAIGGPHGPLRLRVVPSAAFPGGLDLQGFPPTFVLNSDADDLRSSGEAFASELARAGVDVLQLREDGTAHGHLNEPENPGAILSIERIRTWLLPNPLVGVPHEGPTSPGA